MNLSTNKNRHTGHREQTCGCKGGEWGETKWEFGISRCKLLHWMDIYIELMSIEWINSKVLLYNTGNHIQYPVINHNGKKIQKRMYMCIYIYICMYVKWKSLSHVQLFETPWNSPGQNTGVGSLFLLQGIFPTQGLKPGLLHCRQILYHLSHRDMYL